MCDIIDLEACRQKEREENQAAAAALGFIQGGEFEGFFNVDTSEKVHIEDDEVEEAVVLDFKKPED